MKRILLLLFPAILLISQTNTITLPHRSNPRGGTIQLYISTGRCAEPAKSGSAYAQAHHYANGKVYGFYITPKSKIPGQPPVKRMLWLCRYHMAEIIGTDPETGQPPTWKTARD